MTPSDSAETPDAALQEALKLHGAGQLQQAEQVYRQILSEHPGHPDASHYLGVVALQVGRAADAVALIERAVAGRPDSTEALANLGNAYHAAGRLDDAISAYQRAIERDPAMAETLANLGNAQAQAGRLAAAVDSYRRALALNGGLVEAHRNLANVLVVRGQPEVAIQHVDAAMRSGPPSIALVLTRGNVLQDLGRFDESIECYEAVLNQVPDAAEVHGNLANVLRKAGRQQSAFEHYERCLALKPDYAEGHFNLGVAYEEQGEFASAEACFRQALARDSHCTKAWRALANLAVLTAADRAALDEARMDTLLDDEQRMHLEFALARALEGERNFGRAFAAYREANALQRGRLDFSIDDERVLFEHLAATLDEAFIERFSGAGIEDDSAIFVIGMPRSGTTLVEQILASHPDVFGGGELSVLPQEIARRLPMKAGVDYTGALAGADVETLTDIARAYASRVAALAAGQPRITDKLPMNFLNVGIIRVLFPNAAVVHCERDPMDTCLSIFRHYFAARGHHYAYDLTELGEYYRLYQGLMAHWRRVVPGFVYDLRYERLVQDQEAETRKLLDACGLTFHPACLEFHRTPRQVATISAAQVRQPMNDASVGAWRRYEAELAGLRSILTGPETLPGNSTH